MRVTLPSSLLHWILLGSLALGGSALSVSGGLPINATSRAGTTFTINLTSLNGTSAGQAASFSATSNYSFTFVTLTSGSIGNFSADKFTFSPSGFANPFTPRRLVHRPEWKQYAVFIG